MEVLKVTAEGLTTSFRYPHFMQGVQPTYEMPPPATIYGHVCSALGEWFNPSGVRFALHFAFQARVEEVEHTHVLTPATGRLPETELPKVAEGQVNPFTRSVLFRPRLRLYLNRPEWVERFRSPRYAVALGRSQDLFNYTRVEVVRLEYSERVYFEHTLAPYDLARRTGRGVAVLMPRFLDYTNRRRPTFERYVVLHRRVRLDQSDEFLQLESEGSLRFWADPTEPQVDGLSLGLFFHSWVGGDDGQSGGMARMVGGGLGQEPGA